MGKGRDRDKDAGASSAPPRPAPGGFGPKREFLIDDGHGEEARKGTQPGVKEVGADKVDKATLKMGAALEQCAELDSKPERDACRDNVWAKSNIAGAEKKPAKKPAEKKQEKSPREVRSSSPAEKRAPQMAVKLPWEQ
jgi:hypothetical protein